MPRALGAWVFFLVSWQVTGAERGHSMTFLEYAVETKSSPVSTREFPTAEGTHEKQSIYCSPSSVRWNSPDGSLVFVAAAGESETGVLWLVDHRARKVHRVDVPVVFEAIFPSPEERRLVQSLRPRLEPSRVESTSLGSKRCNFGPCTGSAVEVETAGRATFERVEVWIEEPAAGDPCALDRVMNRAFYSMNPSIRPWIDKYPAPKGLILEKRRIRETHGVRSETIHHLVSRRDLDEVDPRLFEPPADYPVEPLPPMISQGGQ